MKTLEFQDHCFSKLNKSLKSIDFVLKMKHKHKNYICNRFIALKEAIIYKKQKFIFYAKDEHTKTPSVNFKLFFFLLSYFLTITRIQSMIFLLQSIV